jgi:CheY-like chemotaxis protein
MRQENRDRLDLLKAHLRPTPRVREAEVLRKHLPTAMIDISDGFSADLGHICDASEVGVVVEGGDLPLVDLNGVDVGETPLQLALSGGEDYELCFTIPEERCEAAMSAVSEATGTPVTKVGEIVEPSRGRVLLVEDNPDVAEASQLMLEQLGYSVTLVTDGATALAAVDADSFDLVMTDIVMAGDVDGLGVARALRQRKPDLPVLLVTGYSDAASRVTGEFTVLRKPFLMAELSRTVARMIADRGQPTAPNVVRLRDIRPPSSRDKS